MRGHEPDVTADPRYRHTMFTLLACADSAPTVLGGPDDTAGDTAVDTAIQYTPPVYPAPCDAWGEPTDVGTIDPGLDEISGVEPSELNPGVLWVQQDHGNAAALYAIDAEGATLATITLDGVENVDMEGLALAPCEEGSCLWIADTGDNVEERLDPVLYRVPEPVIAFSGLELTVTPSAWPLVYGEGQPENVEAFTLTPEGLPVLVTKRNDGIARVWVADTLVEGAPNVLRHIGSVATRPADAEGGGMVTSADLWPDGTRLLLRSYERAWQLDLGEGGLEGVVTAPELDIPYSAVVHVEAVAYDSVARGYWQIPEGLEAPISWTPCLD
jgi:hypothetical protein